MGKAFSGVVIVGIIIGMIGAVFMGFNSIARTHLTADIDEDDTTITVSSTEGFPDKGIIIIGDERIAYSSITDTEFKGSFAQPLIRGTSDTDAVAHNENSKVSTVMSGMINNSIDYSIALITDEVGVMSFITLPMGIFQLISNILLSPVQLLFLGGDFLVVGLILTVIGLGIVITMIISMAGGRRV